MTKTRLKQGIALGSAALAGLLLWWFQPWLLFVDTEVAESLPSVSSSPSSSPSASSTPSMATPVTPSKTNLPEVADAPAAPVILLSGSFISHEHETSGTVRIIELAGGSRVLRLENFETSNGPDLEVWLSAAPVIAGQAGWFLADDGDYVSLGKLKGNKGNQNYVIPPDVDLSRFSSASIWCVRFSVSFGAAELQK